jgi:hypothetical protein
VLGAAAAAKRTVVRYATPAADCPCCVCISEGGSLYMLLWVCCSEVKTTSSSQERHLTVFFWL